ncbi:MAG TPA: hypothetical protein ENK18_00565 [Deltaproteobacteria bacterium]|nr:hypothetical protein [Deltaproteobacteria bacterium]
MNHPTAALSLSLLVACHGTYPDKDDVLDSADEAFCATPYGGPVLIKEAYIRCETPGSVLFRARTDGLTSGGLIFSQETGNSDLIAQWSDEHELESVDADPCGRYDELTRSLITGVPAEDWELNVATSFRCDSVGGYPYHHNADVMSYAMRIYDRDGALADCIAGGDDPNGMINGTYNRVNDPVHPEELVMCAIGIFSY